MLIFSKLIIIPVNPVIHIFQVDNNSCKSCNSYFPNWWYFLLFIFSKLMIFPVIHIFHVDNTSYYSYFPNWWYFLLFIFSKLIILRIIQIFHVDEISCYSCFPSWWYCLLFIFSKLMILPDIQIDDASRFSYFLKGSFQVQSWVNMLYLLNITNYIGLILS